MKSVPDTTGDDLRNLTFLLGSGIQIRVEEDWILPGSGSNDDRNEEELLTLKFLTDENVLEKEFEMSFSIGNPADATGGIDAVWDWIADHIESRDCLDHEYTEDFIAALEEALEVIEAEVEMESFIQQRWAPRGSKDDDSDEDPEDERGQFN